MSRSDKEVTDSKPLRRLSLQPQPALQRCSCCTSLVPFLSTLPFSERAFPGVEGAMGAKQRDQPRDPCFTRCASLPAA